MSPRNFKKCVIVYSEIGTTLLWPKSINFVMQASINTVVKVKVCLFQPWHAGLEAQLQSFLPSTAVNLTATVHTALGTHLTREWVGPTLVLTGIEQFFGRPVRSLFVKHYVITVQEVTIKNEPPSTTITEIRISAKSEVSSGALLWVRVSRDSKPGR
jgi:hypothetical protein